MSKHVGNINMNANKAAYDNEDKVLADAPEFVAEPPKEKKPEIETFSHEGKKVYEKETATGNIRYFNEKGEQVDDRIVTILMEKYPPIPEINAQGGEKKGNIIIIEADYTPHGKENLAGKEVKYISERQEYTEGEPYLATIPKENYTLVRFLRGEIEPKS